MRGNGLVQIGLDYVCNEKLVNSCRDLWSHARIITISVKCSSNASYNER